ncbi:OmpA family protein [Pedobacter insulae]|uniref:Outer membrane protein OmpA n=1 Tax=Pedobacter insulae TaxID=414048 RepID=A0A1I3AI42_9SPHI|nr:OmpA family protein [Pedobacter insulae]SFH49725.1 Outer membrane protein OmpA [Pedobacter insulae]
MNKLLTLLFLCLAFQANAQISTVKKAQQHYDDAQQYLDQKAYDEGIKYLEQAVKADPKFQAAYIQLADIYRRIKQLSKAVVHYRNAITSAPTIEPRIYFLLGESELLTGNYEQAKSSLLQFLTAYKGNDVESVQKAKKYLLDCEFAATALKNPIRYEPTNMGSHINSADRDYFPALTADGETIIFSRVVKGNEDFYTAYKKEGKWQLAKPLSANINTPVYNEGAQSISPDGKYLFFTGCNRPDGLGRCDIYLSRKEGNQWGKAINLGPVINTAYWESQPAISPDGNTLFFLSNRPGGIGGYDIWKSTLDEDSKWTTPTNLGPEINTPFDESTPFIHPDGKTLYFSSDGWPGMGNKDIFFSRIDKSQKWSKPKNLGYPINTFNEEIGLIVSADGTEGLFSSNLAGGFGELDIYSFKIPEPAKPLPVTYVKGIVRDKETKEFLQASILVVDLQNDAAMFNDYTSSETGDFLTVLPIGSNYSFDVDAPGYLFYSQHFNLNIVASEKPFEVEILLEKIKVGAKAILNNIFFETNQFQLLPSSIAELNLLVDFLNTNKQITIEIQGHTDNIGESGLNENLSENRAKEVFNYLIKNGIAAKRLTYKGFGASRPAADNATSAGRQRNRRTEFIITKV